MMSVPKWGCKFYGYFDSGVLNCLFLSTNMRNLVMIGILR